MKQPINFLYAYQNREILIRGLYATTTLRLGNTKGSICGSVLNEGVYILVVGTLNKEVPTYLGRYLYAYRGKVGR